MQRIHLENLNPTSFSTISSPKSNSPPPKYFWSDKGKLSYYIHIEVNRENLMKKVEDWYNKTNETLAFILPLFTQGMENLHAKIIELKSTWLSSLKNYKTFLLNDEIYLKDLGKFDIVEEYVNIFKEESKETNKQTPINKFMMEILPSLSDHKEDQKRTISSSLERIRLEVIKPFEKKFVEIDDGKFAQSHQAHKKALKWMKDVTSKLEKKKKFYEKFVSVVRDNQTSTVNKQRVKKDTLRILIELSISVSDLLNSLTEIEDLLVKEWGNYEDLVNVTNKELSSFQRKFREITPDYIFPELNNFRKSDDVRNEKIEILYKISTLLKKKEIEEAKEKFEMQEDFTFMDLCQYYRIQFLENFEDYIGKSWTIRNREKEDIRYWVTISQDLYLNIFLLEVKNGRVQSTGNVIISDTLDRIGIKVDQQDISITFNGKQPGAFFKKKLRVRVKEIEVVLGIQEMVEDAKDFIQRKEV